MYLYNYQNEGYEIFRFEISNILQFNKDKYKILNKLLSISDKNEKILEIKKFFYSIIHKTAYDEFNKLINNNSNNNIKTIDNFIILDEINKIEKYDINNQRNTCNIFNKENDCNNNPHCIFNNNKCKMKLSKDQMIDYVNKLTSELLYNEIKKKEILQEGDYFVSDIRNINLFIQRDKQTIIKQNNNIKNIFKQIFGKDNLPIIGKRKIKIINKLLIEDNIKYPLIQNGNLFYQEVYNYDTIIRAYTNVFFWHMNTFAINSIRNLGYYSVLQNQILNFFKSLIYSWIINEQNINLLYKDIININIPINNFVEIFKNKLENRDNTSIYIIILYILNKYHNIPILIYDEYETITYIIDNKLISLNNKDKYKQNECLNIKILINKIIIIYFK